MAVPAPPLAVFHPNTSTPASRQYLPLSVTAELSLSHVQTDWFLDRFFSIYSGPVPALGCSAPSQLFVFFPGLNCKSLL